VSFQESRRIGEDVQRVGRVGDGFLFGGGVAAVVGERGFEL